MSGSAPLQKKYRTYSKYMDSRVEWLGNIPEQWCVRRLKLLASINDEALSEETDPQYEMIYVDIGGVDNIQGIFEREEYLFETAPSRARRIVKDGDVIVSTVRTYLRAIAPIRAPERNLIVSTGFAVIRPGSKLDSQYASYALRATYFVENVVANSTGVSYPAIDASKLSTFSIALPDLMEQQRIVKFLDRETAKIDALIEKKERLIDLLQEKRTALITQAVTRGLNLFKALKNSEIEWIGEIPSNWNSCPLFTVAREKGKKNFNNQVQNVLSLSYGKIIDKDTSDNIGLLPESFETYQIIDEGDIILRLTDLQNDKRSLRVGLATHQGIITSAYLCLNFFRGLLPAYAYYLLHAYDITKVFYSFGGGVRQTMKFEDLKWLPLIVPPVEEQRAIINFLGRETVNIDTLVSKIDNAVFALKEYRMALISAAVTGKIDVREPRASVRESY